MKFDVYGRFRIEVRRQHGAWFAVRHDAGKRVPLDELVIPPDLPEEELAVYLDDIFHEYGGPGQSVERLSET